MDCDDPMHISATERDAVYRTIALRRDVRGEYTGEPVPEDALRRILAAAHQSPSVGFMQPWDFVLVRDHALRERIHADFTAANAEAAQRFPGERGESYRGFKLEGILGAPMGICVTCDRTRHGPAVIGRTHMPEMDLYSAVCAVQNLWLAARAENLGVGWVSILHPARLREILGIPQAIVPIAYLCIGPVSRFHPRPELESAGWLPREAIAERVHYDTWGGRPC
jgi:5,6-dimethylbenzimidazole synthase